MKHCILILTICFLQINTEAQTPETKPNKPDYSNLFYWAAHPYKKDFADSVSSSLKKDFVQDSTVDIFFIHPTSYLEKEKTFGFNGSVDDESLNSKTDEGSILYQASVFNNSGRIFAPRYRQAHLNCYFPQNKMDSLQAFQAFVLAYGDVKTAFEDYLKNYNKGRPFIIASHSQGSNHAQYLMKELVDGKPLQNQFIAAYIVGMPVPKNWFANIKSCDKPNQTGCVCSWRTYKDGFKPEYVEKETTEAIVTNPITWDIDKPNADFKENKGSLKKNFNTIVAGKVEAKIEGNVLWTRKPKIFGAGLLGKNYHIADYNFYYINIRENVKLRIDAFLKKQ